MTVVGSGEAMTPREALARCEALCARSEQSSGDISTKLRKWGVCDSDADEILRRLVDDGFVDNARYAHAYVRDKFRFAGWGRVKIAYNLRLKQVGNSAINEALLAEIDEDEYAAKAEGLLRSKYREVKSRHPMQVRAALMRFAAQRGFESNVAMAAINKIMGGAGDYDF